MLSTPLYVTAMILIARLCIAFVIALKPVEARPVNKHKRRVDRGYQRPKVSPRQVEMERKVFLTVNRVR
jgi:hypothetical protein